MNGAGKSQLYILGAGGHGRVVADAAELCGYTSIVFLDQAFPDLKQNHKWPVLGKSLDTIMQGNKCFVAIGNNKLRRVALLEQLERGYDVVSISHPRAVISDYAEIGRGTVVMAGAVINIGTKIGRGCIINTSSSIDHDCSMADGVHVSPGAHLAGGVTVGEESWIGIGAVVKEGVKIGAHAVIGAGAAVVRDVADGQQVLGVPAR